jgi:hypothetical protein|tara:strand:- start:248 stop:463 length:216 start_codon:yes stop_codon:yes gene_type:complete
MSLNLLERPKGTTHARIKCDQGKAEVAIKDFDCFQGVSGLVTFLRETRKGYEELGTMDFDGVWPIEKTVEQ